MCGRFSLAASEPTLRELIGPADWSVPQTPRWNVAPGQDVLTLSGVEGAHRIEAVRWGFAGRDAPIVNARVEGIASHALFRRAFIEGRCVVPADAFYEWQGRGGQPWRVLLRGGRIFGLAGIRDEDGGLAILTRDAVGSLAPIHHRMPVVLDGLPAWSAWLEGADAEALVGLAGGADSDVTAHPVSRRVNSVLNDDAECAREVAPEARQISLF